MKHVAWPVVVLIVAALAAIVVMFGLDPDPAVRQQILGRFDVLMPFIVGLGAGAGAGATAGVAGGYLRGHSAGRAQAAASIVTPGAGIAKRALRLIAPRARPSM